MRIPRYWRSTPFNYRLSGWGCLKCGTFHHYKPIVCRRCRSREFGEAEAPRRGRLLAYTFLKNPPKGFEEQAPYIIGLVELTDGTRILSQIVDVSVEELKPGIEVEAVFRKIRAEEESGIIEYGYKFRPLIA